MSPKRTQRTPPRGGPTTTPKRRRHRRSSSGSASASQDADEQPLGDEPAGAVPLAVSSASTSSSSGRSWTPSHDELVAALDREVAADGLVDLHAHLLGMGSADLWVTQIMRGYLPRVAAADERARRVDGDLGPLAKRLARAGLRDRQQRLTQDGLVGTVLEHADVALSAFLSGEGGADRVTAARLFLPTPEEEEAERDHVRFTDDVVYPEESLLAACGVSGEGGPALARARLEALLCNAAPTLAFVSEFRRYVVLNERKRQFQLVLGLRNGALVTHLDPAAPGSALAGLVRNWFSFCAHDGQAAQAADLRVFRGNFTPEFYPMRYAAKDPIYEQRTEVLALLLNQVVGDYGQTGVCHVELSLGVNDVKNASLMRTLVNDTFTSPLFDIGVFATPRSRGRQAVDSSQGPSVQPPHKPLAPLKHAGNVVYPTWRQQAGIYTEKPRVGLFFLMGFPRGQCHVPVLEADWTASQHFYATWHLAVSQPVTCPALENANVVFVALHKGLPATFALERLVGLAKRAGSLADARPGRDVVGDLVAWLVQDETLERIFPEYLGAGDAHAGKLVDGIVSDLEAAAGHPTATAEQVARVDMWRRLVVGLDLMGDELGLPYCPFTHAKMRALCTLMRAGNPNFGVRVHAGENLPRPSSVPFGTEDGSDALGAAFELHTRLLMHSITKLTDPQAGPSVNVRIGHGVAFVCDAANIHHARRSVANLDAFRRDLTAFQRMLRQRRVACELNPTSNRMLLADSFVTVNRGNVPTLRRFLDLNLPVFLCTDNDGIWPMPKCRVHGRHQGVALEYCDAILNGEIRTVDELETMLRCALASRFVQASNVDASS